MARVTVEDCVDKVPNRFDLVLFAAQRARQISGGAELTIDRDRDKNPVVALREIAEETVRPDQLQEAVVSGMQKVQVDDEDDAGRDRLAGAVGRSAPPDRRRAAAQPESGWRLRITISEPRVLSGIEKSPIGTGSNWFRPIDEIDGSLSFAGETVVPTIEGALFCPSQNALLVADLHLEKASWFARIGQFLPPYDLLATLSGVMSEVERTGATKLFCLGDSFHDRFGCERLPRDARELLQRLIDRLDWTWIVGNHDSGLADHCGGEIVQEARLGGMILRHEAVRGETFPEISGHFHPKSSAPRQGPTGSATMLRRFCIEDHHAGFRCSDGGPRRSSSRDFWVGRRNGSSARPRLRPTASFPARRLVRAQLDRHRTTRRQ